MSGDLERLERSLNALEEARAQADAIGASVGLPDLRKRGASDEGWEGLTPDQRQAWLDATKIVLSAGIDEEYSDGVD